MTKKHQSTAVYDRRAIMRKAHREYAASCRRGDGLTFSYWLAYSWRVARDQRQRDVTGETMLLIAGLIEDHVSRRITLAPEIRKGKNHEAAGLGFRLSSPDNRRRMADNGRPVF